MKYLETVCRHAPRDLRKLYNNFFCFLIKWVRHQKLLVASTSMSGITKPMLPYFFGNNLVSSRSLEKIKYYKTYKYG